MSSKVKKILFVIPAHNEESSIEKVVKDIRKELNNVDILVIDDCSTDKTKEKARRQKAKVITNTFNLGYALSVQTGIKYAKKHNYDYVVQMDADGQHLASEAKKLLDAITKKDVDIVLGSRFKTKTGYKSPLFRRIGTKFFEYLIKILCGKTIKDPLTGFQALNKRTIDYYARPGAYPKYPDARLIIEMLIKKYKIIEVPVKMDYRKTGSSMHNGILQPISYMITQIYSCVIIFIKYVWRKNI